MKIIPCLTFLAFAATGCVSGNLKSDELKVRVGIYDSRAIAVAYVHSMQFDDLMKSKMVEMEDAKASGNMKKMTELEEWGSSHQATFHRQGFSAAPVDDILEHIKDKLPKIAEDANVVALVSKWDKKTLKHYKSVELIDVTDQMVYQFNPNGNTLKIIKQLKEHKPIPLWQLETLMKHEKH